MDTLLYFDYCAIIIISILIISTISRSMVSGRANLLFLSVMIVSFIAAGTDIWSVLLDDAGTRHISQKYIANTLYLFFHSLTMPLYITYIIALTDTWHLIRKNKCLYLLMHLPLLIVIVFLIENLFMHNLFYINEDGHYTRGPIFFVIYLIAYIYFLFGLIYIMYYRKLFTKRRYSSLIMMFPLMLFATLFQMMMPQILIEMFCNAICILYICMMIQRPEEIMDTITGLRNLTAYVDDMNRSVITKKDNKIIIINVTNYNVVRKMLGYNNNILMKKHISDYFRNLNVDMSLNAELYYLGSGKFRVVTGTRAFNKIEAAAERINSDFKPNIKINHMEVNLTACVCIVDFPFDIKDAETLIAFGNELDSRYYSGNVIMAKNIFNQTKYDVMKSIDSIIEYALTNNKFEVYYQPIYSVMTNNFISAEALLRLHTDDGGFISPDIFIPAAEKSGAIHKIGAFVLDEVCRFIASEDFNKLKINYIEVNLSVAQCMQSGLANDIMSTIKKYNIKPSQLNLEITETAASYSQNTLMDNLNKLADFGINLSLDDFGTGYSNMMRIASLPLSIVKLDKTFTDIKNNANICIVLETTIHMIKEMNMEIVVEGIETEEQARRFAELECEFIQGYYYAKPMPKSQFKEFVLEANS
ncbi:MAG: EAL domain-containing protein [Coprococcus sp.]